MFALNPAGVCELEKVSANRLNANLEAAIQADKAAMHRCSGTP
jgi:hypothetical protein